MAFLGPPTAFLGIDVGTSSLKIVELVMRRRGFELSTYAQADLVNPLVSPDEKKAERGVQEVAALVSRMMDTAGASTDVVVAALPSSAVFSTIIDLPNIPEKEMENAVKFAAQDVVPADLDEMVIGWSRVGGAGSKVQKVPAKVEIRGELGGDGNGRTPVFITAAPRQIVERYTRVYQTLKLKLLALELETFPLIRSLVSDPKRPVLIVDIGDTAVTFHIIDQGAPRMTHTITQGGASITQAISKELSIDLERAEQEKARYGLSGEASESQRRATETVVNATTDAAMQIVRLYQQRSGIGVKHALLIGGGANLKGLPEYWRQKTGQQASVGNPWKGLAYPQGLEDRLRILAPTYSVAVGLALRGLKEQ